MADVDIKRQGYYVVTDNTTGEVLANNADQTNAVQTLVRYKLERPGNDIIVNQPNLAIDLDISDLLLAEYERGLADGAEPNPTPNPQTGLTVSLHGDAQVVIDTFADPIYTELGARVSTDIGPLSLWKDIHATMEGRLSDTKEDTYEVIYTATDDLGATATAKREIAVTIDAMDAVMKTISGGVLTQPDNTVSPFSPGVKTNQALSSPIESDPFTVTLADSFATNTISVNTGTYSINGGTPTSADGTVTDGDIIRCQITSSGTPSDTVSQLVTIGSEFGNFIVTTESTVPVGPYEAWINMDEVGLAVGTQFGPDGTGTPRDNAELLSSPVEGLAYSYSFCEVSDTHVYPGKQTSLEVPCPTVT